jgi:hypothetical protein
MLDPGGERQRSSGADSTGATEMRVGKRCRRDDVGVGPSREPQGDVEAMLEDLCDGSSGSFKVFLRAYGPTSRMRRSWTSVWEYRQSGVDPQSK